MAMISAARDFVQLAREADPSTHVDTQLAWDTNVAVELYSVRNLLDELEPVGIEAALRSPRFRYRQHRAKYTLLHAWDVSRRGVPTAFLGTEQIQILMGRLAPPSANDLSTALTRSFVFGIRDFAFDGWHLGTFVDVNLESIYDAADDELLSLSIRDRIPLITWEGFQQDRCFSTEAHCLRNRCRAAGVDVFTPEEHLLAHSRLSAQQLGNELVRSCDDVSWISHYERLPGWEHIDLLLDIYRLILTDSVSEALRDRFPQRS